MEESTIEKSIHELQSKDEDNTQMKNIFQEESQSIASLQNKIETLQVYALYISSNSMLNFTSNHFPQKDYAIISKCRQTMSIKVLGQSNFSYVHHVNEVTLPLKKRD